MKNKIFKFCLKLFLAFLLPTLTFSCNFAPKYKKPDSSVNLKPIKDSDFDIATLKWEDYFINESLQKVIKIALKNNKNLKIAYQNIEITKANYNLKRADLMPGLSIGGSVTMQRVPQTFASFTPSKIFRAGGVLSSFELDFFGKFRNLKKNALEQYLASIEAKNFIYISLISEVSNAYIQYLSNKQSLELLNQILELNYQAKDIVFAKNQNAMATQSELNNANLAIDITQNLINYYQKILQRDKNSLMFLIGVFDESEIDGGKIPDSEINKIFFNKSLISNLPSQALLKRPDIVEAEHNLIGANANIGAARAMFFPSISLSGNYGFLARDNVNLLKTSPTWTLVPSVSLPIFNGGRNIANLKMSKAQKQKLLYQYQQTIQQALKEVMDLLASFEWDYKSLKNHQSIVKTSSNSCTLIEQKLAYSNATRLELINCKIALLNAKQNLLISNLEYFKTMTSLYKALGGGVDVVRLDNDKTFQNSSENSDNKKL